MKNLNGKNFPLKVNISYWYFFTQKFSPPIGGFLLPCLVKAIIPIMMIPIAEAKITYVPGIIPGIYRLSGIFAIIFWVRIIPINRTMPDAQMMVPINFDP